MDSNDCETFVFMKKMAKESDLFKDLTDNEINDQIEYVIKYNKRLKELYMHG